MPGFMNSVNKGIVTLNVKTSNFMEENKMKMEISTKEQEIINLKKRIGEILYENRDDFSMDMVIDQVREIEEKVSAIEILQQNIVNLATREKDILGTQQNRGPVDNAPKIYCSSCGSPNGVDYKFCEKCGASLV